MGTQLLGNKLLQVCENLEKKKEKKKKTRDESKMTTNLVVIRLPKSFSALYF